MSEVDYESGRVDGYSRGREDEREHIIALISRNLCPDCQTDGVPEKVNVDISCAQAGSIINLIRSINE